MLHVQTTGAQRRNQDNHAERAWARQERVPLSHIMYDKESHAELGRSEVHQHRVPSPGWVVQ